MKSSLHSLIPFLPLFCSYQFWRCYSIQFLCSQAHIMAGWGLETRLYCSQLNTSFNHFARTTQKTQPFWTLEGVFTALLHSNSSYSIVACIFVGAGMCLPRRCLVMYVSSDFTIPDFSIWSSEYLKQFVPELFRVYRKSPREAPARSVVTPTEYPQKRCMFGQKKVCTRIQFIALIHQSQGADYSNIRISRDLTTYADLNSINMKWI
jgi:hypothetical protein